MRKPSLHIAMSPGKGRGVFTTKYISSDTVVEIAPVIVMSKEDREHLDKTLLHDYIFEWGPKSDQCCMALGWIPIYNHSYESNCEYLMDFDNDIIFIRTERAIAKGEELTINYNGSWNDKEKVWFDKDE